ncbi:MAG: hypothetical protein ACP5DZ_06120 [Bacteroidales bacterium]
MKKILYLLAAIFMVGFTSAQNDQDFTEPPTRSEFEQVKSKIQVYERRLNEVLNRMNRFDAEIEQSLNRFDTLMQEKMMQLENMQGSEGMSHGMQSQFLTGEDLESFKAALMKEVEAKIPEEKESKLPVENSMLYIYVLGGLFVVLLILLIVLWSSTGKRMKKQKAEVDEKMQEINAMKEQFMKDFDETKTKLQADLKKDMKTTEDNIMVKVRSNKTHIDVRFKDMKELLDKHINELNKEIEEAFVSADKKNAANIDAMQKRMNEAIGEQVKASEREIKTLTDKIAALKKEIDKLKPTK